MALRLVSNTLFKINNSETSVFPALVGAENKGQQDHYGEADQLPLEHC